MAQKKQTVIKVSLIGETGVGKTALVNRYTEDKFLSNMISTIGIDCKYKQLEIDKKKIKLQIWDTAGQERYRTITTNFFRKTMGVFLVFDVIDRKSFQNIENWLRELDEKAPKAVARVLVANKCDLTDERKVTETEARELATQYGLEYFETSAKSGYNVKEAFEFLAKTSYDKALRGEFPDVGAVDVGAEPEVSPSKACCN